MNIELKRALEVESPQMVAKREQWKLTVELHNMYDKHEVYQRKDSWGYGVSGIAFCRTCGQVLMSKMFWNGMGETQYKFKALNTAMLRRYGSDWEVGVLDAKDVKAIPPEFRHFVYEQLFWKLDDDTTRDDESAGEDASGC